MKRLVALALLCTLVTSAIAQGRFKIEPVFSIHFPQFPSSIMLGDRRYTNLEASFVSYYRGSTGGYFNRSLGFQGELPITKRLSARIGAAYAPKDFIGDRSEPCACDAETAKEPIMFKQRYVEAPVSMRYYILAKKWIVFAEGGLVYNRLVLNKTRYISHDGYGGKTSVSSIEGITLNENMFALTAGVGFGYSFNERLDLMLSSNYRRVVTDYTSTDSYRPRAIVFNIGVAIKFGKEHS